MSDFKLIKGDCLVEMSNIEDKSIDMILCDLPYNQTKNEWDTIIPFDRLWAHYERILKENGVAVLFGQGIFTAQAMLSNKKMWRYNLIWNKEMVTGFLNAKKMPLRSHEDLMVFYKKLPTYNPQMSKGKPLHGRGSSYKNKKLINNCYGDFEIMDDVRKNSTDKYPKSILSFQKIHPSQTIHPTQKPVPLLEYLIKTYTNEGDTVLDNCMGVGSTGIACLNTNRKFIGIEIDDNYFKLATERFVENGYLL